MKIRRALLALILIQGLAGLGAWLGLGGGSFGLGLILSFEFAFWAGLGIILCSFWTYKRIITKNITQNKMKNIYQYNHQNNPHNFTHSPTQPGAAAEASQLTSSPSQVAGLAAADPAAASPHSAASPCPSRDLAAADPSYAKLSQMRAPSQVAGPAADPVAPPCPSSSHTLPHTPRARPPLILIKAIQNPQKLTNFWEAKDDFKSLDNWRNKLGLGLIFFSGAKLGAYAIFVLGFLFLHARGWLNLAGLLCGILALLLCLLIYAYEPHKNH